MFTQPFKPWAVALSKRSSLFLQNLEQTVKLLELLALELSFPQCFPVRDAAVVAPGKDDVAVDVENIALFDGAMPAPLR